VDDDSSRQAQGPSPSFAQYFFDAYKDLMGDLKTNTPLVIYMFNKTVICRYEQEFNHKYVGQLDEFYENVLDLYEKEACYLRTTCNTHCTHGMDRICTFFLQALDVYHTPVTRFSKVKLSALYRVTCTYCSYPKHTQVLLRILKATAHKQMQHRDDWSGYWTLHRLILKAKGMRSDQSAGVQMAICWILKWMSDNVRVRTSNYAVAITGYPHNEAAAKGSNMLLAIEAKMSDVVTAMTKVLSEADIAFYEVVWKADSDMEEDSDGDQRSQTSGEQDEASVTAIAMGILANTNGPLLQKRVWEKIFKQYLRVGGGEVRICCCVSVKLERVYLVCVQLTCMYHYQINGMLFGDFDFAMKALETFTSMKPMHLGPIRLLFDCPGMCSVSSSGENTMFTRVMGELIKLRNLDPLSDEIHKMIAAYYVSRLKDSHIAQLIADTAEIDPKYAYKKGKAIDAVNGEADEMRSHAMKLPIFHFLGNSVRDARFKDIEADCSGLEDD